MFRHTGGKLHLYRSKDGDWIVGETFSVRFKSDKELSSSDPGPGQVPGQVQKVQGLRTKDLDLG